MTKEHRYKTALTWTGNTGEGTRTYRGYQRSHTVAIQGKPVLQCSSDAAFRGDPSRHTPEDLLVASVSSCHMLWYLHLCAEAGVNVVEYSDNAEGVMIETDDGGGHFTEITLHPLITLANGSSQQTADKLHAKANSLCFIARSLNFPVHHLPEYKQQ